MKSVLVTFSKDFPKECNLWKAIQSSSHTDPKEQKAVARAMVKDILRSNAVDYQNAYCIAAEELYSGRPYAAYNITSLYSDMPDFPGRKSKKKTKAVLGWVHAFLTEANEGKLLEAFEERIAKTVYPNSRDRRCGGIEQSRNTQ